MNHVDIVSDVNGVGVIAKIKIDDDTTCEMDLSSYHALLHRGYISRLSYRKAAGRKFVSFRDPATTNYIHVGRLLAGCKDGQICRYRDNNTMNLRLRNLKVI